MSPIRVNTEAILAGIEQQFIRAVDDVNAAFAAKKYGISYGRHQDRLICPIPYEKLFRHFTIFDVGISKRSLIRKDEFFYHPKTILFLERVNPAYDNKEQIERIARAWPCENEEVYTYWKEELTKEMTFFEEHQAQIIETKEKVNQTFMQAVKSAETYATENGLYPLSVNYFKAPLEPLESFAVGKVLHDPEGWQPVGKIQAVESRERFKEIVLNNNPEDFKEIFDRCAKKLKEMTDLANRTLTQNLVHALKDDCAIL